MDIENLIEKLTLELEDVNEHKADYCYIDITYMESIIEYLNQLKEIKE